MTWFYAVLAVAFLGCSTRAAQSSSDAACARSDGGTPYTPGIVSCGSTTCAAGNCFGCADGVGAVQLMCGMPPGATCNYAFDCDGPEDCPQGERCYAFESSFCSDAPNAGGERVLCHSDADCDCGQRCEAGECR